ncbi:MAG: anti-sigma-factor antagonist [Ignavibacteria bacterium]|nr:MAG: anti-sigma-factor antagonist [Ignavibacteria bacterium]KAF0159568.1 MAG: anti-sigma-factor antagonist [Ignavibacteria bacterium]
MKINIVEKYTAVVIELKGDIMGGTKDAEFGDSLRKLLSEGKKNIIIDLKETGFVNSSGLGMLISGYTTVKNGGGELKIANVTEKIESLLVITKLTSVFTNYKSIDEAVNSFAS